MVERSRLLARLDAGVAGPLTIVTGPPGAGKTTLVSTWAQRHARSARPAWLSIDRSDTQPAQLWQAVLDAVQIAGDPELRSLAARVQVGEHDFLPELSRALDATSRRLVLILDDFHELGAPDVSRQLDVLLRHPPDRLRLVLVSRTDPPLSLHRLHLEGLLTELRTAELAFTLEEAVVLFERAQLELTDEQAAALHERTEGWAAGLRLAALSLQDRDDVAELVSTFAGDDGSVADYFVEQVLQNVPAELRAFMLKTSTVDSLTPGLVDALLGKHVDGAALLEQLERSGAFLSRVGGQQLTYRYHVMFRELLRTQLRHRMPDVFLLQHRRAARWYAQNGVNALALGHAIAAEDWDLAATLVKTSWLELLVHGEAASLIEMVTSFPRQWIVRDSELALAVGTALLESGEPEQARAYIRLADENASSVRSNRRSEFSFARTVARQYEARAAGDLDTAIMASKKLLAGHAAEALALGGRERRALALLNLGIAETWAGARTHARSTLESALSLARATDSDYLVFSVMASLGLVEALSGELHGAAQLSQDAIRLGERCGWARLPHSASASCALGICAYHWNELAEANVHLENASVASRGSADRLVPATAQLMRALVAIRSGEAEVARIAIHAAREEAGAGAMPAALGHALAGAEAAALIASGRSAEATDIVADMSGQGRSCEGELVQARLALADGDPRRAAEVTRNAVADELGSLQPAAAVELRALAAVAAHQFGDDESALKLVEDALELADTERYVSPFLSVGAPLRQLVVRRIRVGTSYRALAGQLVETLDPHADESLSGALSLVLEPLSAREKAVLRYLPTDLSKAEIASELFVSVNTVKTHMKNIYRKLDVTDRAQAVRRARLLHLG